MVRHLLEQNVLRDHNGLITNIVIIMVRHLLEQNVLRDHNGLLNIIVIIMVRHFLEQNVLCDHIFKIHITNMIERVVHCHHNMFKSVASLLFRIYVLFFVFSKKMKCFFIHLQSSSLTIITTNDLASKLYCNVRTLLVCPILSICNIQTCESLVFQVLLFSFRIL